MMVAQMTIRVAVVKTTHVVVTKGVNHPAAIFLTPKKKLGIRYLV